LCYFPNAVNIPGVCSILESKNTDSYATAGLANVELSLENMSPMSGNESEYLATGKARAGTTISRIYELKSDQVKGES
jgi:hypothetical protein